METLYLQSITKTTNSSGKRKRSLFSPLQSKTHKIWISHILKISRSSRAPRRRNKLIRPLPIPAAATFPPNHGPPIIPHRSSRNNLLAMAARVINLHKLYLQCRWPAAGEMRRRDSGTSPFTGVLWPRSSWVAPFQQVPQRTYRPCRRGYLTPSGSRRARRSGSSASTSSRLTSTLTRWVDDSCGREEVWLFWRGRSWHY